MLRSAGDKPIRGTAHCNAYLFVLFLAVLSAPALAASYFVSAGSGHDDNPGTLEKPWKSISKVNHTSFAPGDTVRLKAGDIWRETLTPPSSGAPGLPITFEAYEEPGVTPAGHPILTGALNEHCIFWNAPRSHLAFRKLHLVDCGAPGSSPRKGGIAVWSGGGRSKDLVFEHLTIERATTWSIYLTGIADVLIRNNELRNARIQHGIYIDGTLTAENILIENNRIIGNAGMCVQFNSNGHNAITHSTVRHNTLDSCSLGGLNNTGAKQLLVVGNFIAGESSGIYSGCPPQGRYCADGGRYVNNLIVTRGAHWTTCFENANRGGGKATFSEFSSNTCVHEAKEGPVVSLEANPPGAVHDHNRYSGARDSVTTFVIDGLTYPDFSSYQRATAQEQNSIWVDGVVISEERSRIGSSRE